ncbi:hypothetical protein EGY05_04245 [Chryseobacterium arthrosphaerae]|uniref:hypothetical protein n=1 Tax=Chryseobacterium arthrosphaerae TaxID=651561 RepID=UPI000F4F645C|nr:hypothetical protein [Chryseobacterium arthrosphaerae]AYZ11181.1 hypothetical protein EGY05_04245 [Chryseobacterium arthrosphaerae]
MLINDQNGWIELETFDTTLYKGMLLEELQQTAFYKEKYYNMRDVTTGYFWYCFNTIEVQGYQVYFQLCFWGDQLHSIHMNTSEKGDAKDWKDWSEEKEMQVFYRNNRFLSLILGAAPTRKEKIPYPRCLFRFSWGEVWSVYDPRSVSSMMGIHYKEEEDKI